MSSGGGGASGDTTYNWNPSMQPRWDRFLNYMDRGIFPGGIDNANPDWSQYKKYTGTRFEPLSGNQNRAIVNTQFLSDLAPSPIGAMTGASNMTKDTLGGTYLTGGKSDPYADKANPWADVALAAQRNQFAGQSPWFNAVKQQGMDEITNNYLNTTKQDMDRMAVLSGAFGGSDHQKAMANNSAGLGKTLANYSNQMEQGQYDRSANLEQQYLQNQQQAENANKTMGGQWEENRLGRGSSSWQNERQRQMGAAGMGYGEQGLAMDRLNMLMQTGALDQKQGQQQRDFEFDQWSQEQNWPFKLAQLMQGAYSTAQGNTGQTQQMYGGGSNLGPILGGLLAGYGLMR